MGKLAAATLVILALSSGGAFAAGGERSDSPAKFPSQPIPAPAGVDPALRQLGARLYRSTALSGSGLLSCAHCHPTELPAAEAAAEIPEGRNPPTLLNVVHAHFFNWDGRHTDLGAAVRQALLGKAQMAATAQHVLAAVAADDVLDRGFEDLLGRKPEFDDVVEVLTRYLETLTTPGAPFDRYLSGDASALDRSARKGLELFVGYGCVACHNGMLLGGNLLQKSHAIDYYFSEHPEADATDLGRFNVTGDEHDRYVFRVPSLRNVELTPPYFNDGSADTLELAVEEMGEHQIGVDLADAEKTAIADFLRTLTAPPRKPEP
jgi:cytochrome c peroxidase